MKLNNLKFLSVTFILTLFFISATLSPVQAAGGEVEKAIKQYWPHKKLFGTYDKKALQRGFQIYMESCSACHSLKRVAYRNLADIGFSEEEIKAIASEYSVTDGPNDEGEMFERQAVPSDRFVPPFPNDAAARIANNGALPPDMSLLVKARDGGEDYIFSLLLGYDNPPTGVKVGEGMYWNKYFKGNEIAMAPPLDSGSVTYSNGKDATLEQAASDIVQFLAWAAEPKMEARKQMGVKVILFLLVFAAIVYAIKRRLWADIH